MSIPRLTRTAALAALVALAFAAPASADPVIAAAGDIACNKTSATDCQQKATSDVIAAIKPTAVLALGDNQYENGALSDFKTYYAPTWGRFKSITHPAIGNHEYNSGGGGYFDYFNGVGVQNGPAGDRSKGYYSYNLGTWHLIALNSNCDWVACYAGSAQERWLRADLAATTSTCILAYWHHPRWSSDINQLGNPAVGPLVQALYDYKADVLLVGHAHEYERFAPQNPSGAFDSTRGLRQFTVGTGGRSEVSFGALAANSQVRKTGTFGVLRMGLHSDYYDWKFTPIAGQTWTDSGSTTCHRTLSDTVAPTVPGKPAATAPTPTRVDLSWTPSTDNVGVTGYRIYRDGAALATSTTTSYSDTSVAAGSTHSYAVTAFDAAGNQSAKSATTSITTPTQTTGTTLKFTPTDDTYVEDDLPSANFGSDPTMIVDGSPVRNAFVRFAVSGIGTSTVARAVLHIKAENPTVFGGSISRVAATTWTEGALTWLNQPAADATVLATLPATSYATWYDVDVTPLVTGDGPVALRISSTNSDGGGWFTKDAPLTSGGASQAPQLLVTIR